MSSTKLDTSGVFQSITDHTHETQLSLPAEAVRISRSGIEFRTTKPIPTMTEMTVKLQSPGETRKTSFTGVVIACEGNRQGGYLVSMLYINVSRQSQERLNVLAQSRAL
jgi:hypothetical protein